MTPSGYLFHSFPRIGRRGGGIAIMFKSALSDSISMHPLPFDSFESVELRLSNDSTSVSVICLYRPPPSKRNKLSNKMFFEEFPTLVSEYSHARRDLAFIGDFKFHFEDSSNGDVDQLKTLLNDHDLVQLVDMPTHKRGHVLDWVIVRRDASCLSLETVEDIALSDHSAIYCSVNVRRPAARKRLVTSRNLRAMNSTDFQADIKSFAETAGDQCADPGLLDVYDTGLRQVLDPHAPLTTRRVSDRPSVPWMTDGIKAAKRELRRAERQWRDTRLTVHREIYTKQRGVVKTLVRAATCMLDPIPTSLTKECLSDLLPLITRIVNSSLGSGVVPPQFKQAVVTPMLKKPGLDPNDLKNFRPVSNLPFISKILEKVVLTQLQKHLSENDLLEIRQSAYRKNHSTETALLSVVDGLLRNADDRLVSVLALLDISAAFDTLDHPILLQRLETTFGISGTVLHWFASYLEGLEQSVKVDNVLSSPSPLQFGVPQGSVLGPILFTLYSQPLPDLICRHESDYHKYADDTQLSKGAPPDQFQSLLCDIQTCIESLVGWMYSNKLKLNAEKTEVLPVASTSRLSSVGRDSVDIGGKRIPFRSSVRNLGVHLDQTLSMQQHISSVCRAAYLELRRIASIRPYLTQSATAQLVSSAITSRLDYCNSILAGLPLKQIPRLQRVQNNVAKLVLRKSKYDQMTPLLQELHWLPMKFRPQYKIATFVYHFFDGTLPGYLSQTLCAYEPTRNLRSSCEKLLKVPKRNTKTFGERSFSFLAPSVWNSLPSGLRNSEILLPFHCLNPDSKLTCLRQLSASRISAVFSPRLPPPLLLPPPPPPPQPPTLTPRMNVLPECFNCHGC